MDFTAVDLSALEPIFDWVWKSFGKEITARSAGKLWESVEWKRAAQAYAQKVRKLHSTMRILGKPKPISLEGIFTDVHVLDKPTALRRFTIAQLEEEHVQRKRRYRYDERREALAVVKEVDKLFILGKPGAGKTTLCKYIALQAVGGQIEKVPVFVSLKELADSGQDVMSFIVGQFAICNFPDARPFIEQLLRAGKALVLFDGLDEVPQEDDERTGLSTDLNNFVRQYDNNQYLITCRLAATDYTFEQFTDVEIADFTDAQVQSFVNRWFSDDPEQARACWQELQRPDHKGLRELASVPLLLSLLCLTYEETLHFPQRPVELYDEALDVLLKQWDDSHGIRRDEIYHKLSLRSKQQMLARIAAETFEQGQYFIPQRALEKQIAEYLQRTFPSESEDDIDGSSILQAIEAQNGIFVESARNIYSFAHLTFQEYYTARYIVDNAADGTLQRLVTHHLTDNRWLGVFLWVASLLNNADAFFKLFVAELHRLVAGEEPLIALLTWAETKVIQVQTSYKAVALRGFYIYHCLHLTHTPYSELALDLAYKLDSNLAHDLDLYHRRVIVPGRTYDHDTTFTRDRDLDAALAFIPELVRDREIMRNHTIAITNALGRFLDLDHYRERDRERDRTLVENVEMIYQEALELSQSLSLNRLEQSLRELPVPSHSSSQTEWTHFVTGLQGIMLTYRLTGQDWHLTEVAMAKLYYYLQLTRLLVDCLDLGSVTDRAAIEGRLLHAPL